MLNATDQSRDANSWIVLRVFMVVIAILLLLLGGLMLNARAPWRNPTSATYIMTFHSLFVGIVLLWVARPRRRQ